MQKILIIGAGAGQVPLINLAKKQGLYTYVVSPFGKYPGIELADMHVPIDIYDKEFLLDFARKHEIDFVLSDQSDFTIQTVSYIAKQLNLPGNSVETAEVFTDKLKYKRICQEHGIPVCRNIEILGDSDLVKVLDLKFPVVVKPIDSQGSRGVLRVDEYAQLAFAVQDALQYSRIKRVIVEEFFEGSEVVCEGFVHNDVYENIAFGYRKYFNLKSKFIPSQTIFPAEIADKIKHQIISYEKTLCSFIKPNFGIVHSEYLINKETSEIRLVESALRGGGVYIASDIIPQITGIDLTELLLESALNYPNKVEIKRGNNNSFKVCSYLCFYLPQGIVKEINGVEEVRQIPGVIKVEIDDIHIGDTVAEFIHKGQRKGPILIVSNDTIEHESRITQIKNTLSIKVETEVGLMDIVWE